MAVNKVVVVDMGAVSLNKGEYLLYSLFPSAGNPFWAFSCADRRGIFQVSNDPQPQYRWCVLNGGPGPNPLWVSTDRSPGVPDVYVVFLLFAQVQSYRLQVVRYPMNIVVQDMTLTAQTPSDTYPVPFDITAL
jgi:hypothetical protein